MKALFVAGIVCLLFIIMGSKEISAFFHKVGSRDAVIAKDKQAAQDYADMLIARSQK